MDFRLRFDPSLRSKHRISILTEGNEVVEWSLQEIWEHEYEISERLHEAQRAHASIHEASPSEDGDEIIDRKEDTRCFLNRPSGTLYAPHSVSAEFVDEGYGYKLEIWDGVGRWSFEPTSYPSHIDCIGQGQAGSELQSWYYYDHDFFASRVVLTRSDMFNDFEKLTGYCHRDVRGIKNGCYCTFKIYLQSGLNAPREGARYVEFYVSRNAKLMTVFETLCGYKLRDTFTLTQFVQFGPERGRGKTYSWYDAKASRVWVKDLEWIVEGGVVWLLPTPYEIFRAG